MGILTFSGTIDQLVQHTKTGDIIFPPVLNSTAVVSMPSDC